jgi:hypothetical protein
MSGPGRLFVSLGILFLVIGCVFILAQRFHWIGRLPGDIYIKKENFTFYFPITTCILISLFISLIYYIFGRR